MPVSKDEAGRRYVQAEVEVPGTPEQVWDAIATGHGISAWFVPSSVEERKGGSVKSNFGPGMDSLSTITKWDPPNIYIAESRDDMGPGDPTIATEWTVEAQSGGMCVVRVVHRWFTDSDKWDNQFEEFAAGWADFFRILRLYLKHFPGQRSSAFQLTGFAPETKSEAWASLTGTLGLEGLIDGEKVNTPHESLHLEGVVEGTGESDYPEQLLLKVDKPSPGILHMFAIPMEGQVLLSLRFYFFGENAATAVAAEETKWGAWISERFPAGDGAGMC